MTQPERPWLYIQSGVQHGPIVESALRNLLRQEAIDPDCPVWTTGMSDWGPASEWLPRFADTDYDPASAVLKEPTPLPVPALFQVCPRKFAVMSIVTGGLYEFFWAYRCWKYFRDQRGRKVMPFWRAWFTLFFHYELMKSIRDELSPHVAVTYRPGRLTIAYLALLVVPWQLPDPMYLLGYLSFVPLLPAVSAINEANGGRMAEGEMNGRFTAWNLVAIVVFACLRVLDLVWLVRPDLLPS